MRLEPGYHVSPHVRLVRLLQKGGMGSVWAADHLALRTQVAVKFMSTALAQDEQMVTRFTREAAFAARIKSPHVVHIHDHGMTEDGIPYIVMELLEGEDLAGHVKRRGPLPLEDVARIVSHICRALAKAHHLGIVHRDIKLNNVFIADAGGDAFAKLLDFGVAKQEDSDGADMTTTGAIVGTLVYMSPEQLHNAKTVDYRSDLWSLAVVAYRAITGHLPFRDEDGIGALLLALNSGVFPAPSELRPGLPAELDAFFLKALQRNPDERFASAREMSEAFERAIGKEPTLIPISRPGPAFLAARAAASAAAAEAGTAAGVASAQTVVGSTLTRGRKPRSSRWVLAALVTLGVLGAASVVILRRGAPVGVASDPTLAAPAVAPTPEAPGAAPLPTAAPPAPSVAPAGPASSADPPGAPPGASAAASSSAAVAASVSPTAPIYVSPPGAPPPGAPFPPRGGVAPQGTRPAGPTKEKDYGF